MQLQSQNATHLTCLSSCAFVETSNFGSSRQLCVPFAGQFGDRGKTEVNRLLQEGGSVQYWVANTHWWFLRQPAPGCTTEELYAQVLAVQDNFYDCVGMLIIGRRHYSHQLLDKRRFLFLQGSYDRMSAPATSQHKWSGMELLLDPTHHGKIFCHGMFVKEAADFLGFGLNYTGKPLH